MRWVIPESCEGTATPGEDSYHFQHTQLDDGASSGRVPRHEDVFEMARHRNGGFRLFMPRFWGLATTRYAP